ncbi:Transposase DDE domain-containing protein [Clostridium frigidicarnis]|uniref:Transposase DDE domain-containing protein n=1 Tax=Clostridium frigidicarnis TaxID=84698 RepID=A0A1I1BDJ8_9CLOT|nr:Transposase DDE domain-containing protein [Clostridium frigidicarnis]
MPEKILSTEEIYDIYTLRWQVERMFKIWKSNFNIDNVKPVKLEGFKYFLYGKLISLIFSSIIVFTSKDIIYEEDSKEISELKAFY